MSDFLELIDEIKNMFYEDKKQFLLGIGTGVLLIIMAYWLTWGVFFLQ